MKKFLALMVCLIMLCVGTIQAKESKISEQSRTEQMCIDIGEVQTQVIQFDQVLDCRQMITDIYTIKKADEQSIHKYILQKDALYSRYMLIPDCLITFIGKDRIKYITHYSYKFSNLYNQPPSYCK